MNMICTDFLLARFEENKIRLDEGLPNEYTD